MNIIECFFSFDLLIASATAMTHEFLSRRSSHATWHMKRVKGVVSVGVIIIWCLKNKTMKRWVGYTWAEAQRRIANTKDESQWCVKFFFNSTTASLKALSFFLLLLEINYLLLSSKKREKAKIKVLFSFCFFPITHSARAYFNILTTAKQRASEEKRKREEKREDCRIP